MKVSDSNMALHLCNLFIVFSPLFFFVMGYYCRKIYIENQDSEEEENI